MPEGSTGPVTLQGCTVDLVGRRVHRDGRELVLTRLEAELLARLMAEPGRDVPREVLLTEVWGHPASSTTRAVDFAVRRLRNKLGEPRVPIHILTAHGVGYRFAPLLEDRPEGPALGHVPLRPPVRLATGLLDLDRRTFQPTSGPQEGISRLEGTLLDELFEAGRTVPRDELIRSVWGRGHHSGSLDAAVRRLRLKLEVDASRPEVLVTVRGSGLRLEVLAARGSARRTNLLPAPTRFIDRPETMDLREAMHRPLVTILGTAGMGKTRLAREVGASRVEEDPTLSVWFCDLASAVSEHGIVRAVERVLGLEASVGDPVPRIGRVLARATNTVLILDNFEHLKAHVGTIAQWMDLAPEVRIVVTSRERLGLPDEHALHLSPLTLSAAAQLFVERTQDPDLDPEDPVIQALVKRLDCLPLAIELAAARADQLGPETLLERLDRRLDLLIRRPAGAQTHHNTLRGALDWSWDLLTAPERAALGEASLFEGSFTVGRAEAVVGVFDVAGTLDALCARSLMNLTSDGGYRLDEGIRAYAREKLELSGQRGAVSERYRQVHLNRGEACVAGLRGGRCLAALTELRSMRPELLAIHRAAEDPRTIGRSALVLDPLLRRDGPPGMHREIISRALGAAADPDLRWRLCVAKGHLLRDSGDLDQAVGQLEQAVTLAADLGEHTLALARRKLGIAYRLCGRNAEAETLLTSALQTFRGLMDPTREARTLANLAMLAQVQGRHDEALALHQRAVAMLRASGDLFVLTSVLMNLGALLEVQGDLTQSETVLDQATTLARQLGDVVLELLCLERVARLRRAANDPRGADALLQAAQDGYGAIGLDHYERAILVNRGALAMERGDLELADRLLSQAMDRPPTSLTERTVSVGNYAILLHLRGDPAGAVALLGELAQPLRDAGARPFLAMVLAHLAAARADLDEIDAAVAALDEARQVVDASVPGMEMLLDLCDGLRLCAIGDHAAAQAIGSRAQEPEDPADPVSVAERHQHVHLALLLLEQRLEGGDVSG